MARHGEPPAGPLDVTADWYWEDPDLWDGLYGDMAAHTRAERAGLLDPEHYAPGEYPQGNRVTPG